MAINLSIGSYVSSVSEIVGSKTGLCLNEIELSNLVKEHSEEESEIFKANQEKWIRIRSEDFEATVAWLLYKTGFTEKLYSKYEHFNVFHKYKNNEYALEIYNATLQAWCEHVEFSLKEFKNGKITALDPTPVIDKIKARYGELGFVISSEIAIAFFIEQRVNVWTSVNNTQWKDIKDLEELFKSESLKTQYGSFLDQRFIHYLINNFDEIDKMHWRKFEGLACEFFDKKGCHVEIGPGRDDGGVDLRVWDKKTKPEGPACILVQCKRQKSKVEKVVVKALWADMIDENAKSGLIVTSSALSKGAKAVCNARNYNIEEVNRSTLLTWLKEMRVPGHGIFMGE